jgi:hypothetical protein
METAQQEITFKTSLMSFVFRMSVTELNETWAKASKVLACSKFAPKTLHCVGNSAQTSSHAFKDTTGPKNNDLIKI